MEHCLPPRSSQVPLPVYMPLCALLAVTTSLTFIYLALWFYHLIMQFGLLFYLGKNGIMQYVFEIL